MRKLVEGVLDFRRRLAPSLRGLFADLSRGQKPDCLFVACSDSRVVPNLFSSTNPGDLFVLRNVGNIIPPAQTDEGEMLSEGAAVEFAIGVLNVPDVIICGHSECGAMIATGALVNPAIRDKPKLPEHVQGWLKFGYPSGRRYLGGEVLDDSWAPHDQLSQVNVLQQLDHLQSYPLVKERVKEGKLGLHGWWYDVARGEVLVYDKDQHKFVQLDETAAKKILKV
mmetsp:Transcript_7273/g.12446  ORF Transcript_7273/g.12446 Transcript_7273/m.12446 type:complete len:224 (-) Transcript_7273:118-789(-)